MIFIILKNSVLEHTKNKYIVLYNSKWKKGKKKTGQLLYIIYCSVYDKIKM
mgnify:CR=1 FL=1